MPTVRSQRENLVTSQTYLTLWFSLQKEVAYYEKEVAENQAKLNEMKSQGRDEYDVKKFAEVLGESEMMVPDSKRRLSQALDQLRELLVEQQQQENQQSTTTSSEWYSKATSLLKQQQQLQEKSTSGSTTEPAVSSSSSTPVDDLAPGEAF